MNNKNIHCVVYQEPILDSVSIVLYMEGKEPGSIDVLTYGKPKLIHYTEDDMFIHDKVEPSIRLSGHMSAQFIKAISDAIDKFGIKPEERSKTEGLYEAQSFHLKDLRQLLKLHD